MAKTSKMICGCCLSVGTANAIRSRPGSGPAILMIVCGLIGLFMFLPALLFAGFFFLWAVVRAFLHASREPTGYSCPNCKATAIVPIDTVGGRQLVERAQAVMDGRHAAR